jgi:hypothetical protein
MNVSAMLDKRKTGFIEQKLEISVFKPSIFVKPGDPGQNLTWPHIPDHFTDPPAFDVLYYKIKTVLRGFLEKEDFVLF